MATTNTPSLEAILATLAQFAPPPPRDQISTNFKVPEQRSFQTSASSSARIALSSAKDPRTISTWAPALRHVMALVAKNDQILVWIRKLIKNQQDHEAQWWSSRQAIAQRHALNEDLRAKKEKDLTSVIYGTNHNQGILNAQKSEIAHDRMRGELADFDKKIYRAQLEMASAMSKELENMGIPFFGMNKDLLSKTGQQKPQEKPGITEKELMLLQKRMLELLEDLASS